jgi:hypothetical protein
MAGRVSSKKVFNGRNCPTLSLSVLELLFLPDGMYILPSFKFR